MTLHYVALTGAYKHGNVAVPRRDLEMVFAFLGWNMTDRISQADILYAANVHGSSSKLREARALGVTVESHNDLAEAMSHASGGMRLADLITKGYEYNRASFQKKLQLVAGIRTTKSKPKEVGPKPFQSGIKRNVKL